MIDILSKKKFRYDGLNLYLHFCEYRNGGIALELLDKHGDCYTVLTTWIDKALEYPCAWIDENNNPGAVEWLRKHKIATPLPYVTQSGFCVYRMVKFNQRYLK